MKIGNEDYKYKFIAIQIDDKNVQQLLKEALNAHIVKKTKDIEMYSKSESYVRADDVKRCADEIATMMKWRDNLWLLGTDTWVRDLEFYKHGIEHFI